MQFLAGDAAFNITSFGLWGNELYKISSDNELGVLGILASWVTVPLAIHFSSELLDVKPGSWGAAICGSIAGFFIVSTPLLFYRVLPRTYLALYLGISVPIVSLAQIVYDLTMQ